VNGALAGVAFAVGASVETTAATFNPASAAPLVAQLGFLAHCDLPDRPGPAWLLVALRDHPTLRHYDPEVVDYWVSSADRGVRRSLTRDSRPPIEDDFSWGMIRIVDRLRVTNEYLTFGGHLSADLVDGVVIAIFASPAPLLRRGGHSQGWDRGAEIVGAFFARFLLAIDYVPGFERRAAGADPLSRYAAFVSDAVARYRSSPVLREEQPELWTLLNAEERRLRANQPAEWAAGEALRAEISVATSGPARS
jgi:hypothetical protein